LAAATEGVVVLEQAKSIAHRPDGRAWVGGQDLRSWQVGQWRVEASAATGRFEAVAFGSDGEVWAIDGGYLYQLTPAGWTQHTIEGRESGDLADLAIASDGTIWVAGRSGLHRLDDEGWRTWRGYGDGLPPSYDLDAWQPSAVTAMSTVFTDGEGQVWAAGATGCARWAHGRMKSWDREDGLPPMRFGFIDEHGHPLLVGHHHLATLREGSWYVHEVPHDVVAEREQISAATWSNGLVVGTTKGQVLRFESAIDANEDA
jgi:hypothetical protein